MSETFLVLKVMTHLIIHLNAHTSSCHNLFNPPTPFMRETFHPQDLLQKVPIDFIIGLLKIYFENNLFHLLTLKFVQSLVENNNTIKNISSWKESVWDGSMTLLATKRNILAITFAKNLNLTLSIPMG
jgi:hypothetical protein